jgi:hypothetical protein
VKSSPFREELLAVLEELTGELGPSVTPNRSSFLDACDFLFNYAEVDRDLRSAIGRWLRNEEEASALAKLAPHLRAVLHEGGGWESADDAAYQNAPSWPKLRSAAASALRVFRAETRE